MSKPIDVERELALSNVLQKYGYEPAWFDRWWRDKQAKLAADTASLKEASPRRDEPDWVSCPVDKITPSAESRPRTP